MRHHDICVCTVADLEGLETLDTLPGFPTCLHLLPRPAQITVRIGPPLTSATSVR